MKPYQLTGGARIGLANATYPFATLKVDQDKLELKVSAIGNFIFTRSDIISIEAYQSLPILGEGVKINHRVENYHQKIIFWTLKSPSTVIDEIRKTGFLNDDHLVLPELRSQIIQQQKQTGSPFKTSVLRFAFIGWNLLVGFDLFKFISSSFSGLPLENGTRIALVLIFGLSLSTLFSKPLQKLFLKEGRNLSDIKRLLYFLMLISSFMLTVLSLFTSIKQ
ncbi:MAG: hypothetical protein AB8G15_18550 [Saprospiraceae bacterium]